MPYFSLTLGVEYNEHNCRLVADALTISGGVQALSDLPPCLPNFFFSFSTTVFGTRLETSPP